MANYSCFDIKMGNYSRDERIYGHKFYFYNNNNKYSNYNNNCIVIKVVVVSVIGLGVDGLGHVKCGTFCMWCYVVLV